MAERAAGAIGWGAPLRFIPATPQTRYAGKVQRVLRASEVEYIQGKLSGSLREHQGTAADDLNIAPVTCRCCPQHVTPRRQAIQFMQARWFNRAVISVIVLNCVLLAMEDPVDPSVWSNKLSLVLEPMFTVAYTIEAAIRMMALGLLVPGGYLRNRWNWLDLAVVMQGWLDINGSGSRLSAMRTLRVMRPLRAVSALPSLQMVTNSVVGAIPSLFNVLLFLLFVFACFAVMAVQLWAGVMRGTCMTFDGTGWVLTDPEQVCSVPCSEYTEQGMPCTESYGQACDPVHVQAKDGTWGLAQPSCKLGDNPGMGAVGFDNFGQAMLTLYTSATLEGWSDVMYQLQDAWGLAWVPALYFVGFVMIGSFFLMNLGLAAIFQQYDGAAKAQEQLAVTLLREAAAHAVQQASRRKKSSAMHRFARFQRLVSPDQDAQVLELILERMQSSAIAPSALYVPVKVLRTRREGAPAVHLTPAAIALLRGLELPEEMDQPDEPLDDLGMSRGSSLPTKRALSSVTTKSSNTLPGDSDDSELDEAAVKARAAVCCMPSRARSLRITSVRWFEPVVTMLIIANTIMLCVEYETMPARWRTDLFWGNAGFTGLFTLELILRWRAVGGATLVKSKIRVFELVTVVGALVELLVAISLGRPLTGLTLLKSLRMLRLLRLASGWPALRELLVTIASSFHSVASALALLGLALFVYILLGMQLFGGQFGEGVQRPRAHFDNLWWASVTVFQLISGENWNEVLYDAIANSSDTIAVLYFASLNVVGSMVLLNLFLAVLMAKFEGVGAHMDADNKDESDDELDAEDVAEMPGLPGDSESPQLDGVRRTPTPPQFPAAAPIFQPPSSGAAADGAFEPPTLRVDAPRTPASPELASADVMAALASPNTQLWHSSTTAAPVISTVASKSGKTKAVTAVLAAPAGHELAVTVSKSGAVHVQRQDAVPEQQSYLEARYGRPPHSLHTYACGVLAPTAPLRMAAARLMTNPWFDRVILCFVLLSTVLLALSASQVPLSPAWEVLMLVVFGAEMLVRMVAMGLFVGKQTYFQNGWNILDFIVVATSLAALLAPENAGSLAVLRAIRAVRGLRPLRMMKLFGGIRLVAQALVGSARRMGTVAAINLLFIIMLAVIGQQTFMGALGRCNDEGITDYAQCTGTYNVTGSDCAVLPTAAAAAACTASPGGAEWPRMWEDPPQNFNNIWSASLTVFEVGSGEMWPDIMYTAVDAVGVHMTPIRDHNQLAATYFIGIQVVLAFFLFEMFTSVIVDYYVELRDHNVGAGMLTPQQLRLLKSMQAAMSTSPLKAVDPGLASHAWHASVISWMQRPRTEIGFVVVIMLSIVPLALHHYGQSPEFQAVLEGFNLTFLIIFLVEAAVKIAALTPREYFRNGWNVLDFVTAVLSCASFIGSQGSVAALLRMARVGRLLRLVKFSKNLQRMARTLVMAALSLVNVSTVLALALFLYAILGVGLFRGVKRGEFLTENAHFDDLGVATLTLFRCMTGESFNGIMHDCMIQPPYCDEASGNCGHPVLSPLYFISFTVLCGFVLLNMLVASVVSNYAEMDSLSSLEVAKHDTVRDEDIELFKELWRHFDPRGTKFVSVQCLLPLVMGAPYPLGLAGHPALPKGKSQRALAQRVLLGMSTPQRGGQVEYHAFLQGLIANACRPEWQAAALPPNPAAWPGRAQDMSALRGASSMAVMLPANVHKAAEIVQRNFRVRRRRQRLQALAADLGRPPTRAEEAAAGIGPGLQHSLYIVRGLVQMLKARRTSVWARTHKVSPSMRVALAQSWSLLRQKLQHAGRRLHAVILLRRAVRPQRDARVVPTVQLHELTRTASASQLTSAPSTQFGGGSSFLPPEHGDSVGWLSGCESPVGQSFPPVSVDPGQDMTNDEEADIDADDGGDESGQEGASDDEGEYEEEDEEDVADEVELPEWAL